MEECPALHSPLIAPPHIAGDGFALGLGEGGEECSHHFAGHRRSVNVLFLEADADTERFQLSDGFQAFLGIAGKAGDGFYQHPVDQPSAAICQEPLEVLTLFSRCPSNTLICVYVNHSPVFLAGDQVTVVTVLGGEGVELVIRGGADTAYAATRNLAFWGFSVASMVMTRYCFSRSAMLPSVISFPPCQFTSFFATQTIPQHL